MNYIKQIIYELRNQKMMTWVSISGTALAIFLIMAIFMADRLLGISIPPDSNRQKIMKGQAIDFQSEKSSGSGMGIDYNLAKQLYSGLDGVKLISYVARKWGNSDAGSSDGNITSVQAMEVDDSYWKMYDYQFLSGKPFDKAESESAQNFVVITESVARKVFGEVNVSGRQLDVDNIPYFIKGVVKDSFPLLPDGTIEVFLNFKSFDTDGFGEGIFGATNVRLLLQDGIDPSYIKQQVEKRYDDFNRSQEENNNRLIYHYQPYTSEELAAGSFGSNNDPSLEIKTRLKALVFALLLILPAINLSSMTRSRLRTRISEIGVRRAFGAKKNNIIFQIFTENLLISFIGGIIGLGLSLIFLAFLSGYFIAVNDPTTFAAIAPVSVRPVIWHVFDFSVFFIALGACFILNILSATIPAWKASLVRPAIAISKTR
ncbi:MAG: ABC transporter permease [Muribaculaceae bacterium]|nr:ABC transporter permease [Muribaculaceae bacterium]